MSVRIVRKKSWSIQCAVLRTVRRACQLNELIYIPKVQESQSTLRMSFPLQMEIENQKGSVDAKNASKFWEKIRLQKGGSFVPLYSLISSSRQLARYLVAA